MNIFTYLKKDHDKVNQLMDQIMVSRSAAKKKELFQQIKQELLIHSETEDATFYKTLRQHSELKEKLGHAKEEHEEVKEYLEKLEGISFDSDKWIEKFGELRHAVNHHVQEEEGEIFTKAKLVLSDKQAQQLASEMEAMKQKLLPKVA